MKALPIIYIVPYINSFLLLFYTLSFGYFILFWRMWEVRTGCFWRNLADVEVETKLIPHLCIIEESKENVKMMMIAQWMVLKLHDHFYLFPDIIWKDARLTRRSLLSAAVQNYLQIWKVTGLRGKNTTVKSNPVYLLVSFLHELLLFCWVNLSERMFITCQNWPCKRKELRLVYPLLILRNKWNHKTFVHSDDSRTNEHSKGQNYDW